MRKDEELLSWNSMHSSPSAVESKKNYLWTKSIGQLIALREKCHETILRIERYDRFYDWDPAEELEQVYYGFEYEDALNKVATLCKIIEAKRLSMHAYYNSPSKREEFHKLAEDIITCIKKKPDTSYEGLAELLGKDAKTIEDYLIEVGVIETAGTADNYYWKINKQKTLH